MHSQSTYLVHHSSCVAELHKKEANFSNIIMLIEKLSKNFAFFAAAAGAPTTKTVGNGPKGKVSGFRHTTLVCAHWDILRMYARDFLCLCAFAGMEIIHTHTHKVLLPFSLFLSKFRCCCCVEI